MGDYHLFKERQAPTIAPAFPDAAEMSWQVDLSLAGKISAGTMKVTGGIVSIIVSTAFDKRFPAPAYAVDRAGSTVPQADYIWRIILMFGSFPATLTYYWRMQMPETARYTALVAKNVKQAAADMSKVLQVQFESEQDKVEVMTTVPEETRSALARNRLHLEDLGGDDEGGRVGAEVGEEEGQGVHDHEADAVVRLLPVVVGDGQCEHEDGHEEEAHQLDGEAADDVNEEDGEPVARDGGAEGDERLCAGDAVHLVDGVHLVGLGDPPDAGEDVLLEEVLAVKGDVEEEPGGGGSEQVQTVFLQELPAKQAVVLVVTGGYDFDLVLLALELDLEHLRHVRRRLLRVLRHQRRVPCRLRHLHPPVVGERRREGAEHEDDPPDVVGLRDSRSRAIDCVGGCRKPFVERRGDDDGDDSSGEDAEPLHGEHSGDEGPPGALIGVLGHDGGGKRVVAADTEPQPEAEEAQRRHHGGRAFAEGEARGYGADEHQKKRKTIHSLPSHLVTEPPKEELAGEGAAEGDAVDGSGNAGGEGPRLVRGGIEVIDSAE
ncbi:hypothetical protein EJ110_NYTH33527 [Nymphaea thermarum]|nr:hypothetical protein EJ110_NYTH33527 [Nymphaea thermarum]